MAGSKLFKGRGRAKPAGGFQPHRQLRFLVTAGWTTQWVHCPICGSVNAGWRENGTPIYSGGHVMVRLSPEYEAAAACRCQDGAELHANGMAYYDTFPPDDVLTPAFHVLWDLNAGPVPKDLPKGPPAEVVSEFNHSMFRQLARHLAGELTAEQLSANRAVLERMLGPRLIPEVAP